MDKLGPYELVEQIDLAGYVWTARKSPESQAAFVVRFRDTNAADVRAAAEIQQKYSASGAGGWAPVHDIGPAKKGGAYYATDFYPWSAQLLFEQKDRLTSVRLLKLCDEICAALDGKPHGNLKLSNVLLSSRDLDAARVFLTDPLPRGADAVADRRGVGRIIFELVTGTPFKDYLWPVQTGEQWNALGPEGSKWLAWCNRLLAPPGNATVIELADFRKELEAIRPTPTMGQKLGSLPWMKISAVAAFVAVAIAGTVVGLRLYNLKKLKEAMLATHQAVHQDYRAFANYTGEIDRIVTSQPDLESGIAQSDLLSQAAAVDSKLDLTHLTRIDELPDKQAEASQKITALRKQWMDGAMQLLASRHYDNALIDDAYNAKITAIKSMPDEEAAVRLAAQFDTGMANLAAVWPKPTDPAFRASRTFGRIAVEKIAANAADSDTAIASFKEDLAKATAGDPVYTAITEAGEAIETEEEKSRQLASDMKKLAPAGHTDLYDDLKATASTASISDSDRTPAGIQKWKDDSVAQIKKTRDSAIAAALAKAHKITFGIIQPINDGYAAFIDATKNDDPETTLKKTALVILGLNQLQGSWPSAWQPDSIAGVSDADHARISTAYQENLTAAELQTVRTITADGTSSGKAVAALKQSNEQFQSTAALVEKQFQTVASAFAMLSDRQYPASVDAWKVQWDQMKTALTEAAQPHAGWPDPVPADATAKVDDVLTALGSSDFTQLHKFADAGQTPALLNAVATHWPTIHSDDPMTDYQMYQDLTKGLGQLPDPTRQALVNVWAERLKKPADAAHADSLWDLAQSMSLEKATDGPALYYINDWIGYLQARYPKEKKSAIADFITHTAAFDKWGLTASQQQTVSDFRDRLQFRPKPGTGKLPLNFTRPVPMGDAIYTPPFDPGLAMRFKLMVNKAGGSYYLSTTEVPAGWFIDIVGTQKAPVFRKLMDIYRPYFLVGPSPWYHPEKTEWIAINTEWISPGPFHPWADQFNVDPPSPAKPMQYVSPLAAMDAARLIGCRLPTVDEWQLAFNSDERDHDDNTGGQTWQTLRQTISTLQPDLGPATLTFPKFKAELPLTGTAPPIANVNDVLWYRDVPRDFPKFHDMRGNVAEWVLTNPAPRIINDDPITVVDDAGTHTVANQDDKQLDGFYKHVMRIGLTSTSSSNEDESTPRPPEDPKGNHHHQFFDVGFRLAFDDMPADPEKFIADAVHDQAMLSP
jgi:formylglycine-generating enzyme required for sulfatase activity